MNITVQKTEEIFPIKSKSRLSPKILTGCLRFLDLNIILISGVLSFRFMAVSDWNQFQDFHSASLAVAVLAAAVVFDIAGIYQRDYCLGRRVHLRKMLGAWLITFALLLAMAFALKITDSFSRLAFIVWFAGGFSALALSRVIWVNCVRAWRRDGRLSSRTAVVGGGEHGTRLIRHLADSEDTDVEIVGLFDDRSDRVPPDICGHRLVGGVDDLIQMIRTNEVDQVIVALPWQAEDRIEHIARSLAQTPVHVLLAPDLVGFRFLNRDSVELSGVTMLNVFARPVSDWAYVAKVIEDRIVGAVALFMTAPIIIGAAIAVKLDSRGPVLFRQKRLGFNNRPIEVLKFRTMYSDMTDADAESQTTKDDPRVTNVGRILRKTSIDELPQLINVMMGSMSIVGPRPHALGTKAGGRLFEEVVEEYAARHKVKPGVTGWAQVNGWRGETETEDKILNRVECDLYYINHWSIWLDLYIIMRTPWSLIRSADSTY